MSEKKFTYLYGTMATLDESNRFPHEHLSESTWSVISK